MALERTLVLIKPDATARGLGPDIKAMIDGAGYSIIQERRVISALETMREHYKEHSQKPFYEHLLGFMMSGPIEVLAIEGEGAIRGMRELIGATDPHEADQNSIRGKFCDEQSGGARNFIHASDSTEAAEAEYELWFDREQPYWVKLWLLPDGRLPVRKTAGAVALDAHARAIVHPEVMDPADQRWRLTLFDFKHRPTDRRTLGHIVPVPTEVGEGFDWSYRVPPREQALVGIGFATAMPLWMHYWLTPRSGLATVFAVTNSNAPGTVDSDYRGEAGVGLINHGHSPFDILYQDRIIQVMFQPNPHPEIILVDDYEELEASERGAGGFGSTGVRG